MFDAAVPEARASGDALLAAITTGQVHTLDPSHFESATVSTAGLVGNYNSRMVPNGSAGRPIYDALKLAAPNGICPLCGQRTVATLDHYLPKQSFPLLAVTPYNLIPACADCNYLKKDAYAGSADEVPLHPYFEDIDSDVWLSAAIVEAQPGGAVFEVSPPSTWSSTMTARVLRQFKALRLAPLYASHAGVELQAISIAMELAHTRGGAEAVRQQLSDQAESRKVPTLNHWAGALYRALSVSDWYCDGGFL